MALYKSKPAQQWAGTLKVGFPCSGITLSTARSPQTFFASGFPGCGGSLLPTNFSKSNTGLFAHGTKDFCATQMIFTAVPKCNW